MKQRDVGDSVNPPWIEFGDGFIGKIKEGPIIYDNNGHLRTKITISPEELMLKIYQIPQEKLINGAFLEIDLPSDAVWQVNADPRATRWRTELNWEGKDTIETSIPLKIIMDDMQPLPELLKPFEKEIFEWLKNFNLTLNLIRVKTLLETIKYTEHLLHIEKLENKALKIRSMRKADQMEQELIRNAEMLNIVKSPQRAEIQSEGQSEGNR